MTIDIDDAISALLAYRQADMEGVEVLTSRQAIHEVADELRRMRTLAQSPTLPSRQEIARMLWIKTRHYDPTDHQLVASDSGREFLDLADAILVMITAQPPAAPVETNREDDEEEMASIGRAFMETIEQARNSGDEWLKNWAPLQCPSELIFDLLNREVDAAPVSRSSADNVESLIEQLLQACVDYENCDRSASKFMRGELEKAKQALRDHIRAVPQGAPDPDNETYEIGKRDGYEDAIQDLDLATGGDGEFRGSTFPGGTIDVEVMKERIIARCIR